MSDLDVKPDVSEYSRDSQYEQPRRARRAVLVFEDDPDFGEFLAPRPAPRHPSLIQYPQSTPPPGLSPVPAPSQPPPNLGHSERASQQPAGNYQPVEVSQVERPSAARPWPAPPSEYANRPRQPQQAQGGVNPLLVLLIFALLAVGIGAFVFFFDKKVKKDEIEHVRRLVAEVVGEYKSGNRVPEQLKEVADMIEGVFRAYGLEPLEVEKVVRKTKVVAAEL